MKTMRLSFMFGALSVVSALAGGTISAANEFGFDLSAIRGGIANKQCYATQVQFPFHTCECEATTNCAPPLPCDPNMMGDDGTGTNTLLGCSYRCASASMPRVAPVDDPSCSLDGTVNCTPNKEDCGIKLNCNGRCCIDPDANCTSTGIKCSKLFNCSNP